MAKLDNEDISVSSLNIGHFVAKCPSRHGLKADTNRKPSGQIALPVKRDCHCASQEKTTPITDTSMTKLKPGSPWEIKACKVFLERQDEFERLSRRLKTKQKEHPSLLHSHPPKTTQS